LGLLIGSKAKYLLVYITHFQSSLWSDIILSRPVISHRAGNQVAKLFGASMSFSASSSSASASTSAGGAGMGCESQACAPTQATFVDEFVFEIMIKSDELRSAVMSTFKGLGSQSMRRMLLANQREFEVAYGYLLAQVIESKFKTDSWPARPRRASSCLSPVQHFYLSIVQLP
jgi:hypothetical protein